MNNKQEIVEALLNGQDISVVLENRFGVGDYKESYLLSDFYVTGSKFIGKFRQVHATDYLSQVYEGQIDNRNPAAYCYTNFAPIVCCSSLTGRFARFYSSYAYSSLVFKKARPFEVVYELGITPDVNALYEAVDQGKRLKVRIDLFENTSIIVPLHTIEVYLTNNTFNAYSEYDGYPDAMRNFDWVSSTAKELSLQNSKVKQYAMTTLFRDTPFWISYFKITQDNTFKVNFEGRPTRDEQALPFNKAVIFAEKW